MAFLLALAPSTLHCSDGFKVVESQYKDSLKAIAHVPNIGPLILILEEAKESLLSNYCVYLFQPVWDQHRTHSSVCLTWNSLVKQQSLLKNTARWTNKKQMTEAKKYGLKYYRLPKVQKQKLGKILWDVKPFKSTHVCREIKKATHRLNSRCLLRKYWRRL